MSAASCAAPAGEKSADACVMSATTGRPHQSRAYSCAASLPLFARRGVCSHLRRVLEEADTLQHKPDTMKSKP